MSDIDRRPVRGVARQAWDALAGRGDRQVYDESVTAWEPDGTGLCAAWLLHDDAPARWRAVRLDEDGRPAGYPGYGRTARAAVEAVTP